MNWENLLKIIKNIFSSNPPIGSILFWLGALVISRLLSIRTADEKTEYTKSQSYYWHSKLK